MVLTACLVLLEKQAKCARVFPVVPESIIVPGMEGFIHDLAALETLVSALLSKPKCMLLNGTSRANNN